MRELGIAVGLDLLRRDAQLDEEARDPLRDLDQEMAAAHRRVEDVEGEHGFYSLIVAPRSLDGLVQEGVHRRLYDVLHDVVRGIVATRRLPLPAVVQ